MFVAVLGASSYTYAEARWTRRCADWIGAHVDALAFLGGVPKLLVCDNLQGRRHGSACRYEPGINRTYQEMAAHYGTAILPARPRKPARQGDGFILHLVLLMARVMGTSRAGRAPRPPRPLRIVGLDGTSQRPRLRLSL